MNGLPYYKAYPRDFIEGTIGMAFEEKAAYRLVLDLIYMHGGGLPDDPKYIAGVLGCSVRKWNSLREMLIKKDKLQCENKIISNFRASLEVDKLKIISDKNRINGPKAHKNKDMAGANAQQPLSHTDTDTDNLIDKSIKSPVSQVWKIVPEYLAQHGQSVAGAKRLTGKFLKTCSPEDLLRVVDTAKGVGTQDPIPYITKAINNAQRTAADDIDTQLRAMGVH